MARARMYGWSDRRHNGSAKKVAQLKGQAGLVRDVLDNMTDLAFDVDGTERAKFLAASVTEAVIASGKLVTRQDEARVVLYYLMVFKKRGWVEAAEQAIEDDDTDDETEDEDDVDDSDDGGELGDHDETVADGEPVGIIDTNE